MTGLEPAASWSQITHSTKLNYIQIFILLMARREGFEPPISRFVAAHSIQLSYRRISCPAKSEGCCTFLTRRVREAICSVPIGGKIRIWTEEWSALQAAVLSHFTILPWSTDWCSPWGFCFIDTAGAHHNAYLRQVFPTLVRTITINVSMAMII